MSLNCSRQEAIGKVQAGSILGKTVVSVVVVVVLFSLSTAFIQMPLNSHLFLRWKGADVRRVASQAIVATVAYYCTVVVGRTLVSCFR